MTEIDEKFLKDLQERVKENAWRQKIHIPYIENTGHPADFEIQYNFYPQEEFKYGLHQGIRTDFLYEGDDPGIDGIHMIWPEFIDDSGLVITDRTLNIPSHGRALMWIGMHESRVKTHQKRLKVGTNGYLVVGSTKLATAKVTKIIGLHTNES